MHVTQLWLYPIKSCAGLRLDEAVLDERGLQNDRRWMLVDEQGKVVTQREVPRLALVQPDLSPDTLTLSAPRMPVLQLPPGEAGEPRQVDLWGDEMEVLSVPGAKPWFTQYAGRELDLVYQPDSALRPLYHPELRLCPPETTGRHLTFVDGNPLHIVSEESVADLNTRLESPVEASRFRANIVVAGAKPYAEDSWETISIGNISFDLYETCKRCVLLNIDPNTATVAKEPLATLASYRREGGHVVFGRNIVHRTIGIIRVGEELRVH